MSQTSTIAPVAEGCPGAGDERSLELAEILGISTFVCKECGREYPIRAIHVCDFCFGPLSFIYDLAELKGTVTRESIAAGPRSIWRYAKLLPVPAPRAPSFEVGATPLRSAPRLAAELGLKKLWLKLDLCNPTNSFKDRAVAVAVEATKVFGLRTLACASTGNLANSVAAQAAAAGLESVVFIPRGLEAGKVTASSVYGGRVVEIDGSYDDVNRVCSEIAEREPWGFVNINLRPFYAEGSKTVAFEIVEQLGWREPDAVVIPVASGALMSKVARGFGELHQVGLIDHERSARLFGAQPSGCAPVADAFETGADEVRPIKPRTIVHSLAIGAPADGPAAIAAAKASGGGFAAPSDEEVLQGIELLARTEGVFTEPAGGTTIAALEQLVRTGRISAEEETVAVITGAGLKTIEVLEGRSEVLSSAPHADEVLEILETKGAQR